MIWDNPNASVVTYNFDLINSGTTYSNNLVLDRGNVGIGTAAPGQKLHVSGNALVDQLWIASGAGDLKIDNAGIGNTLAFTTSGLERVRIDNNGNVGIGTPGPSYTLDVRAANAAIQSRSTTNGNNSTFYLFANNSGGGTLQREIVLNSNNDLLQFNRVGVNHMSIDGNGYVGINCIDPQYYLHVVGDVGIVGTIYASAASVSSGVVACSDIRYKKEISPLPNALTSVMKLQGVNYYWKQNEFPEKQFNDTKQIGFIAQELEKIYPEMVFTDNKGFKSVDYSRLTPVLVEAVKELNEKNEKQQKMIEEQQKAVNALNQEKENSASKLNTAELKIEKLEAAVDLLMKSTIKEEAKK